MEAEQSDAGGLDDKEITLAAAVAIFKTATDEIRDAKKTITRTSVKAHILTVVAVLQFAMLIGMGLIVQEVNDNRAKAAVDNCMGTNRALTAVYNDADRTADLAADLRSQDRAKFRVEGPGMVEYIEGARNDTQPEDCSTREG